MLCSSRSTRNESLQIDPVVRWSGKSETDRDETGAMPWEPDPVEPPQTRPAWPDLSPEVLGDVDDDDDDDLDYLDDDDLDDDDLDDDLDDDDLDDDFDDDDLDDDLEDDEDF